MKKAAVIGNPVSHSLSPYLHNHWCKIYNIQAAYKAIQLEAIELDMFLDRIRGGEYVGASVTLPLKKEVLLKMDGLDDAAKATGAVNTIVAMEGGKLFGRNTDPQGFSDNLRHSVPEFDATETTALVLGTGGAARAVIYALLKMGISGITVIGRTKTAVEAILDFFSNPALKGAPWYGKDQLTRNINLIVNATPLGLPGFGALELDFARMAKDVLVYDLVYTPLETGFLKSAKAAELKTIGGLGMLIYQAIPAFEAWFGVRPHVDRDLYAKLERKLSKKDH